MLAKITIEHLLRIAIIYIRQSSMSQVNTHLESQRLQYNLEKRAIELGWQKTEIIDEDLGLSGSGTVTRPGFQKLLTAIVERKVGAIFCFDASRLARNNREWSQLIEYCGMFGVLIIDLDGVFDPANISDRVLLGLKGTMCEYESAIFRQRSQAAIWEKAGRGEFITHLPAGYIKVEKIHCEIDPDKRIQDAFSTLFKKFRELGSALGLVAWFRDENIEIPCRDRNTKIIWKLPTKSTITNILKNPIYAGAYARGKTQIQIVPVDGVPRKVTIELPIEKWKVLIKDHHPAYISWDEFLANRNQLKQNVNKRGVPMKSAPKNGSALLVGLLRCQRCGQKFRVRYSKSHKSIPRYVCTGQETIGKVEGCLSFGGRNLEQLISQEILHVVEPAAILCAEQAEQLQNQQKCEKEQYVINALKQAEYEAGRCFEQYNLADPKNRLVAQTLEENWNDALAKNEKLQAQLAEIKQEHQPISEAQRQSLYQLAENLPGVWNHPQTDVKLKKRIIQTLIHEIIVDIDDNNHLAVTIHWIGGKHTQYRIKRRKKGQRENYLHPDCEQIITGLAEVLADPNIARILNLLKITTAAGMSWNANRVKDFRNRHHIRAFNQTEYDKKGLVNLQQAAEILHTHPETIKRLITAKIIKARQVIKYSPWIIDKEQLKEPIVSGAISALEKGNKTVVTKAQYKLDF
ncbi:MAG: recombinase family protein [Methanosarcinaceae archaeon]